jgi:hypothetical protein
MEILRQGRAGYWMRWRGGVSTGAIGVAAEAEAKAETVASKAKGVVRIGEGVSAGRVERHQMKDHDTFHAVHRAHSLLSVHVVVVSRLIEWTQRLKNKNNLLIETRQVVTASFFATTRSFFHPDSWVESTFHRLSTNGKWPICCTTEGARYPLLFLLVYQTVNETY